LSLAAKSLSALRYGARRLGPWRRAGRGHPDAQSDGFTNADLQGYPNNHNFQIDDGRAIPSFQLYWRWRALAQLYPRPLESLLDVGCCRGWFVLEAASRPTCKRAVGIDVYEPFLEIARKAAAFLGAAERTAFHSATLKQVIAEPERYGAPFQTVLVINCYHYLYWGSLLSPERFSGHEEILEGLARITSGVVIFSNPLVLDDCPESTREIAQNEPERAREYTPERFAEVASRFFTIESHGYLNKHRRLEVLRARPGSVSALAPSRRESGAGEGA